MPHRRRQRYPLWLKVLVRTWAQQGLTLWQINARLAESGWNISSATIAGWFARPVNTHV